MLKMMKFDRKYASCNGIAVLSQKTTPFIILNVINQQTTVVIKNKYI